MSHSFNPNLHQWKDLPAQRVAGTGYIEIPGKAENLRWQTRSCVPSQFENELADALEKAYEAGAKTAEEIVNALNAQNFKTRSGHAWTVALFESEMAILGY